MIHETIAELAGMLSEQFETGCQKSKKTTDELNITYKYMSMSNSTYQT